MSTATVYKCPSCDEVIDTENDMYYAGNDDRDYCEDCHNSDMASAATVTLLGPGWDMDDDGHVRYYVTQLFVSDRYGEDDTNGLTFKQKYVSTDAWRGYNVTSIDGWSEIESGWTTGNWGDEVSDRKRPFRDWAEGLYTGDIEPPCEIALITDSTSNVFSTAIGIWVKDENVQQFTTWLNGDAEVLRDALR